MMHYFDGYNAAGEKDSMYYNISENKYQIFRNEKHSSLFQTVFSPKLISVFENSLKTKQIDVNFWKGIKNCNLFCNKFLAVGIKGMAGRKGIGIGHNLDRLRNDDKEEIILKGLLGNDIKYYKL
jgi:hypothetical protein